MAASKASISKWKALESQGVKWGTVAKQNAAEMGGRQQELSKLLAKDSAIRTAADNAAIYKLKKEIQAIQATQPHKAPGKFSQVVAPIAKGLIQTVAIGGAGVGVLGAIGSATGLSSSMGSIGGGGGISKPNVSQLLGGQDDSMGFGNIFGGIKDTLGDIGDAFSEGKGLYDQYSGLFQKAPHTGSKSITSSADDGPSGAGSETYGQPASAPGMSTSTLLMLGGAALLLVLVLRK